MRQEAFDALDNYIASPKHGPFLLTAAVGLGKTMLLANYVKKLKKNHPAVYARFCGASDLSSEPFSLWKSIFDEAEIECPEALDELRRNLSGLLEELSQKGGAVILLDAINQLPDGLEMLSWISRPLPDGIKLIVSFASNDQIVEYIEKAKLNQNVTLFALSPFETTADKELLIEGFLRKYLKALDDDHINVICSLQGSENPLFLKILLSELRMFGAYKQLSTKIKNYGSNPREAFDHALERLENDPAYVAIAPIEAVSYLFSLLSYARNGLSGMS